jgi:hypothetical protein
MRLGHSWQLPWLLDQWPHCLAPPYVQGSIETVPPILSSGARRVLIQPQGGYTVLGGSRDAGLPRWRPDCQ